MPDKPKAEIRDKPNSAFRMPNKLSLKLKQILYNGPEIHKSNLK